MKDLRENNKSLDTVTFLAGQAFLKFKSLIHLFKISKNMFIQE